MTTKLIDALVQEALPEDQRDTVPTPPPVRDTIPAPAPRATWGEVGLVLFAVVGSFCCLYLGFEWARHWAIGGWLGVEWFASIVIASALPGAGLATAITMRGLRR